MTQKWGPDFNRVSPQNKVVGIVEEELFGNSLRNQIIKFHIILEIEN